MSRTSFAEEEDHPGQFALYHANLTRSFNGKRGQASLRELREALLAMPRKRLIEGRLAADGDVCSLGTLILLRESKRLGSFEAAQAALEEQARECRCSHFTPDHVDGVCLACMKHRARQRLRHEYGSDGWSLARFRDGRRNGPLLELVVDSWAFESTLGRCMGFEAKEADDEDDEDDGAQGDLTLALAEDAGMPHPIAWYLMAQTDSFDFGWGDLTPEARYAAVLKFVEGKLRAA